MLPSHSSGFEDPTRDGDILNQVLCFLGWESFQGVTRFKSFRQAADDLH